MVSEVYLASPFSTLTLLDYPQFSISVVDYTTIKISSNYTDLTCVLSDGSTYKDNIIKTLVTYDTNVRCFHSC